MFNSWKIRMHYDATFSTAASSVAPSRPVQSRLSIAVTYGRCASDDSSIGGVVARANLNAVFIHISDGGVARAC